MSCEKELSYSFFIVLTQWHEFSTSELTNFQIFINHLPLNVTLFSKSPYLLHILHIKINYETGFSGMFFF